jgi:membrane-associated phospholipid phosphatase
LASLAGLIALAAACLGFAVLAVLVGTGALSGFDQYAVEHWMPGLSPGSGKPSLASGLIPYHGSTVDASDAATFPAGFLISLLIVLAGAFLLDRRGRGRLGLIWIGLFLAGSAIEVLCKTVIDRPALYARDDGRLVEVLHFQNSFPSGHSLRSLVIAAVLASLLRGRWAVLVWLWAGAVLVDLLVDGIHAPTDILAGALLAGVLMLSAPLLETAWSRVQLRGAVPRLSREAAR